MALSLSCLCWSEKHETEDWHWLAWMYNCKHGELHRMPQVPSPVSWHDMTVMWHDHAVMVTSHHTSTLAARSGSWYLIVCIKLTKVTGLHERRWSWYQHWAIVSRGEWRAVRCVTSQVKVNHDILTPDSRDNLLKVPFDIEILIYFQIKIPSSKKSLLFLCFVQSY